MAEPEKASADSVVVQADALRDYCSELLKKVGQPEDDARIFADSLVESNLRGVDTHGVVRLKVYVERIEQGLVKAEPEFKFTKTMASTGIFDADTGQGQIAALRAMGHAIELAKESGLGAVAVRNSAHFGAAAYFTTHAARQGFIGMAVSHAEADMVPFGGRKPVLGTNPVSVAIPRPGGEPFCLDMATSAIPMGAVMLAAKEGREIPAGWAVDVDGKPVTDPKKARAVKPMAGPKGYALSIVVDAFSALLTTCNFGLHVIRQYDDWTQPQRIGHFVGALNIEAFVPKDEFEKRIAQMFSEIKSIPPAEGFKEVLIPGELEAQRKAERSKNGIPLGAQMAAELKETGDRLGVPWPGGGKS